MIEVVKFMDKKDKKSIVVKSNKLIEARHALTLAEQRIILLMISLIKPEDEDFKDYRIKIADFMKLVEIEDKGTYRKVEEITKNLMEKVLEIREPNTLLQVNWLASAHYIYKEGYVNLCFSPMLKPYLLKLKECFTQYELKNVIRLKSIYSIRIYELLKQYERIGQRTFEIEELRKILGIKVNEYKLYGDLKRFVLHTAQRELSLKTDIEFKFSEIKTGRKITDIEFVIFRSEQNNIHPQIDDSLDSELLEKLIVYGINRKKAQELLDIFDKDRISQNLDFALQKYKIGKVTENLAGFIVKAIEQDFRPKVSLFEKGEESKRKNKQELMKKKEEIKGLLKQIRVAFENYRSEQVKEKLEALSPKQHKPLLERFLEDRKNDNIVMSRYKESGLDNKIVASVFNVYAENELLVEDEEIDIKSFAIKKDYKYEDLKKELEEIEIALNF
jgi:plasmid replication initiation protein